MAIIGSFFAFRANILGISECGDYVLAHDYMRGTEGNQSWMFDSNDIVTPAQTAVILI